MSYILINPYIEGKELNTNKKKSNEAAEDIWTQLSSNIKNYTPEFYFTIQKAGSSKMFHYQVNEDIIDDKVSYIIKNYIKDKEKIDKVLSDEIKHLKQNGGKKYKHRKDDDSSSSSSSSDDYIEFKSRHYPHSYALTYYPSIYGVKNILLPTFATSFVPYVRIGFPITPLLVYNP